VEVVKHKLALVQLVVLHHCDARCKCWHSDIFSFFHLLNTKECILENAATAIDCHSMYFCFLHTVVFHTMTTVNCLVTNILQNVFHSFRFGTIEGE